MGLQFWNVFKNHTSSYIRGWKLFYQTETSNLLSYFLRSYVYHTENINKENNVNSIISGSQLIEKAILP